MSKTATPELPVESFATAAAWEKWLAKHHQTSSGLWLKFYKKNSGQPTVTYAEAVDIALCYGWIDSQVKSLDDRAYLQKFTPRRSKSLWSKINIEKIEQLIAAGRMKPAGLAEVNAAKQDGRWQNAYNPPSQITMPADLKAALDADPKAKAFYESLNKTNTYAILWRLETAKKPETRQRRLMAILKLLQEGNKIH